MSQAIEKEWWTGGFCGVKMGFYGKEIFAAIILNLFLRKERSGIFALPGGQATRWQSEIITEW